MGTDIHFVIERQRTDSGWEAVYSKAYAYHQAWTDRGFALPDPDSLAGLALRVGNTGYDIFAVLSRVRCEEDGPQLMQPGFPPDLSDFTAQSYPDDGFLHSFGYGTLADLRTDLNAADLDTGASLYTDSGDTPADAALLDEISRILDIVETIARRADAENLVLLGPEFDPETHTRFPEMSASAHGRLASAVEGASRSARLKPLAADTVRLVVAYDN